jgi:uncharacterized membrane protein
MSTVLIYEEEVRLAPSTAEAPCETLPNVGETERIVSALAGGGLVAWGLTRGSLGGLAMALIGGGLVYRGVTGHCMAYQTLGIDTSGFDNPAVGVRAGHGVKFETSLAIDRPAEELFQFWQQVENLPLIMEHLISVTPLGGGLSHWVARGPMDTRVEWDAETINLRENELIAWRSLPGSELDTAGSVHFESLGPDRGTLLRLSLKYDPPLGKAGAAIAKLLASGLEERVQEDLRRFKQWMETGETPTTAGQPRGVCS